MFFLIVFFSVMVALLTAEIAREWFEAATHNRKWSDWVNAFERTTHYTRLRN